MYIEMATAREQATTVSTYDYLDEPILQAEFCMCIFSLSEDVIEDRKLFIMKDFLTSFSGGMKDLMEHLRKKFLVKSKRLTP
jgi:hypothetical protein